MSARTYDRLEQARKQNWLVDELWLGKRFQSDEDPQPVRDNLHAVMKSRSAESALKLSLLIGSRRLVWFDVA
ncbi:hypothetical protein [Longimycelium tulufanense]|uniref:hypothetical protein n=1 Tax=Longimycelium tulufanense TaxID=907463 RepID=UPI0016677077|nr:hypothetical protein [Longimycelium tulufanense]